MTMFPSIWLGDFRSKAEWDSWSPQFNAALSVYDWIDDHLLYSRHPFSFPAYCSACEKVTKMRIDWMFGAGDITTPSVHPAWTETSLCSECGLNSRMRALWDFLKTRRKLERHQRVYIAEQLTTFYRKLKRKISSLVGSEYLGPDYKSGTIVVSLKWRGKIRHEDLRALSFADGTFDLVITQDVFEHIFEYKKAFTEIRRVLAPGGVLVFTIPFFWNSEHTVTRASVGERGEIIHHLPPEIHRNPTSSAGSLCFQNFGWDILSSLREAGFADAAAHLYWGPWQGHLGFPFFVFSASKSASKSD